MNIGSGNKIKIKDIVDLVSHKLNKKFKINIQNNRIRPKHSEVNQLVCNNLKAKKIINWKPIITFDEGITRYIEWAKEKLCHTVCPSVRKVLAMDGPGAAQDGPGEAWMWA